MGNEEWMAFEGLTVRDDWTVSKYIQLTIDRTNDYQNIGLDNGMNICNNNKVWYWKNKFVP